ncbi:MAG: hypothetical protein IT379_16135 [Deltaproteobacteria bacterium]|nr:hypothetical protein [Deltaproteobacteria bacterium]
MANPIKPTGPGGLPPSIPDVQPSRTERAGTGDFRRELANAAATREPGAGAGAASATPAAQANGTTAVLADLRAGRIDRSEAVERLVAHQVERVAPAGLSPSARAELESLLRSTLESDPNLARLMEDASREA